MRRFELRRATRVRQISRLSSFPCLMLFLATFGSPATAQMTVMIPAYEMTCAPKNPVMGPDGISHQYAPYQVAWDGQNRMIIKPAGADGSVMGNAVDVQRVAEKVAFMKSSGGTRSYSVKLDFERGSAAYNYGRVDQCTVAKIVPMTPQKVERQDLKPGDAESGSISLRGVPLGWVYIPKADIECNKMRCDINGTVQAYSRPDLNSAVVAVFKGGTTRALVQDNIPRKWNFFVLGCDVKANADGSLSCPSE